MQLLTSRQSRAAGKTNVLRIALAGNPNSGKTSLFNRLTGARQHVGNYPGVTVEKREGARDHRGHRLAIVDLPGTYSLTAYSIEEIVARDALLDDRPDVVVNVLDASNTERNLYLTVQLIELGVPFVVALNMSDVAAARGMEIDAEALGRSLGAPVIPTVAVSGHGMDALLDAVIDVAEKGAPSGSPTISYGASVDKARSAIATQLRSAGLPTNGLSPERAALRLLENDERERQKVQPELLASVDSQLGLLETILDDCAENAIAEARYRFIADVCRKAVRSTREPARSLSDKIDAVVTHRFLALPLFLALMYGVFQLTFTAGAPLMDAIDAVVGWIGGAVGALWPEGSESALRSLLVDGIIAGVGSVLVFLPNIMLLFLAIGLLEDTGYMARAAFIMERLMRKIGLHGRSFIPMLIGFGCSVPAIMATRTLDSQRDRLVTILVTPLMSCGARLPIYALIIPAFFPPSLHTPVLWLIYVIGVVLAIVAAKCLRATVFRGEAYPFVMELPPYRMPNPRSMLLHVGERAWLYVRKAGTIILGVSIVLWALTSYPQRPATEDTAPVAAAATDAGHGGEADALAYSAAGRLGHMLEPVLSPLGFDWRIGTALIGAFAAKEVFVAQMGIVYSVGEADEESTALRDKLREHYSPLQAFCIMLFCLISAPCMATIAVTRRETNSWKWALLQLGGLTALGYGVTLTVYQAGSLLGLGIH